MFLYIYTTVKRWCDRIFANKRKQHNEDEIEISLDCIPDVYKL